LSAFKDTFREIVFRLEEWGTPLWSAFGMAVALLLALSVHFFLLRIAMDGFVNSG